MSEFVVHIEATDEAEAVDVDVVFNHVRTTMGGVERYVLVLGYAREILVAYDVVVFRGDVMVQGILGGEAAPSYVLDPVLRLLRAQARLDWEGPATLRSACYAQAS